jgi:hypothetical protein
MEKFRSEKTTFHTTATTLFDCSMIDELAQVIFKKKFHFLPVDAAT